MTNIFYISNQIVLLRQDIGRNYFTMEITAHPVEARSQRIIRRQIGSSCAAHRYSTHGRDYECLHTALPGIKLQGINIIYIPSLNTIQCAQYINHILSYIRIVKSKQALQAFFRDLIAKHSTLRPITRKFCSKDRQLLE